MDGLILGIYEGERIFIGGDINVHVKKDSICIQESIVNMDWWKKWDGRCNPSICDGIRSCNREHVKDNVLWLLKEDQIGVK